MAKTIVTDVERADGPITVPTGMSLRDAVTLLTAKAKDEETVVEFHFEFRNTLPLDGAWGLKQVLDTMFGGFSSTAGKTSMGFFGPIEQRPESISVAVGPNESVEVPFGVYNLPHDVMLECSGAYDKVRRIPYFVIHGTGQRRYAKDVNEVVSQLRSFLRTNSIYRGKALRIEFTDEVTGKPHDEPEITFVDLSSYDESDAIFSAEVEEEIRALVYTPLSSTKPRKIGVLLTGIPGVGKTLVMAIAAKKALDAGRTVIYCASRDFTTALRFGLNYEANAGAVVVCEDIDRILCGDRDASMDAIYNAMDGPDTKRANVSVLLTTNDLSVIPDPFLRPGRVGQTLELTPPDSRAVLQLLLHYGAEQFMDLTTDEDLSHLRHVSARLAGRIPATIADVVARAITIAEYNQRDKVATFDLEVAERSMSKQLRLLEARNSDEPEIHPNVQAATILAEALRANSVPHLSVHTSKGNGDGRSTEQTVPLLASAPNLQTDGESL